MFERMYEQWVREQMVQEFNPRRRELLEKSLAEKDLFHGTREFLRAIWLPAFGNFNHLYIEWEVRDMNNGYRYLDLAYLPGGNAKGCIEIQGYRSHARDIDVKRFKDLCNKQALLSLGDWLFMPVAYLSIKDEPEQVKQLVLSFVGKFISSAIPNDLGWAEAEALRLARRLPHPLTPKGLAEHLRISERHARRVLRLLTEKQLLIVASGQQRYRTYRLPPA